MCDDHAGFSSHKERKSLRWKQCNECRGLIAPGDIYVHSVFVSDGHFESTKVHSACDAIAWAVAKTINEDGCRIFEQGGAETTLSNFGEVDKNRYRFCWSSTRSWLATLRWMRVHSRLRFAHMLGEAWAIAGEGVAKGAKC